MNTQAGSQGGNWTNNLQNAKGSLSFPLLESPLTAFKLLLGQDVDLFLYDAPRLGIDFTYSQFFPVPPIPILGAELAGRIAAVADFAFGFDTTGISKFNRTGNFVDVFDGFFVSDRVNPDGTGTDVPEVYLRGSLTAGAKLELLVAEAGVRGGVFAGVDFNLHDNDRDGRVRGGELAENFELGPIHIFDVSGSLDAGLVAFVDVNLLLFELHEEFEIARVNLLDFEIDRPASGGPSPTELLTSRAGDVLTIKFTAHDDAYKIVPGATEGSIIVQGQGLQTTELTGITQIVGDAMAGNDVVSIAAGVDVAVQLDGGAGDDRLTAGGGPVVFTGGAGNDQLVGGPAEDHLQGGEGDDTLIGGSGNDLLEAGSGDDYVDGGRNDDVILGGEGNDVLVGGFGADTLEGSDGDDVLDGERGDDLLRGGLGADQISGGRGSDVIEGGGGDDVLLGQEGSDTIDGGEGHDVIDGGELNDVIAAGAGSDTIHGGTGNDQIDAGAGDDLVRGGGGPDTIAGGEGDDRILAADDDAANDDAAAHTIDAGAGNDVVIGARGDDLLIGGDGNDVIVALAGNDVIEAGEGNDQVDAGAGDDLAIGGFGNDTINGGQGSDLVWGGVESIAADEFRAGAPGLFEVPPRFEEATALGGSSYSLPLPLFTPKIVSGLSVDGAAGDGNDLLRGGDGTDWLFGGADRDSLFGDNGHDYLDGGLGNDTDIFGGPGDDVLRGGTGDDVIHGGPGIDQVYGGPGRDTLFGDAGAANGSTDGQRLFGGEGADSLFAWAAGDASDADTKGDELWGGIGGDFLYGNRRDELLIGESGNDFLSGDWAAGPDYAQNQMAALNAGAADPLVGSRDTLLGGSGQDQLFGGGGDDRLEGGPDGDWLEGQDGRDALLGGGGIDFIVLDVDPNYRIIGEQRLDGHGNTSPDDNATDVLLVMGTNGDDTIRLRQSISGEPLQGGSGSPIGTAIGGQLMVEHGEARIEAVWTENGNPLIEQFRVSGGTGDDTIEFVRGENAVDVSSLVGRSRDFVSTIDGGPGNDRLFGSPGRDRIDGGRGSDMLSGFAGDDRLWGDQGSGDGSVTDHDVIYAGAGNDDVLGGQGTNELFAWSLDPRLGRDFGVFRGSDGTLRIERPEEDSTSDVTYELEDTGLNRIIGSPRDDQLYGGAGLDLLFGGGGNDELFTRDGTAFEDLDGEQAGDAWKEYARSTGHVWYAGGSQVDDVISVDFVTEPGILQGHHLVTRLTDNNGSFSFDAQVRLDFSATDDDGRLIWDPNDVLADVDDLANDDPFARAAALDARFSDAVALSRLLPAEGEFQAIIVDALGGNDQVNVGPTVQKSVWIDAGEGDDTVKIESGRAILIDQTDPIDQRNDSIGSAFTLGGPPLLLAPRPAPTSGMLTADASFYLIVDELSEHVLVEVPASITDGTALNTVPNSNAGEQDGLDELVEDINRQISQTAAAGRVIATRAGNSIALSTTSTGSAARLAISAAVDDPAVTELGLAESDSALPSSTLVHSTVYGGLTIDNPSDVDHYQFELSSAALGGNPRLTADSIAETDGLELALFDAASQEMIGQPSDGMTGLGLSTLQANTPYVVRVSSNSVPTVYSLMFDLLSGVDAAGVELGADTDFRRQDVIFGGAGNDVLQGGSGEDFLFGGAGNDVLTGGKDRGASDLLFGQAGDDDFQSIPDGLPLLTGTETTFLPTQSDRYDGGAGDNRIVFVGGDLDRRGRPIDDFVALKFNRLLQRYELSSLVWDINNQQYVPAESLADLAAGSSLREWHFFTALAIDKTTVDLAAGNDTLRADSGFIFEGDPSATTWGIEEGDIQAGAEAFTTIEVFGGSGNDKLFGGAASERFSGGGGSDFIAGGLGDDFIEGGADNDVLSGGTGVAPDRFEFTSRTFGSGPNDTFQFAAELPIPVAGTSVSNLSFHEGDSADWYLLSPRAIRQFAGQSVAAIRPEMIRAIDIDSGEELNFSLFLAEAAGDEQELVPVNTLVGVVDQVLLRVENESSSARRYSIEYLSPLGDSIDVSVADLTAAGATGFSRAASDLEIRVNGQNLGGQGVVIPIGDFNGDSQQDFILSLTGALDEVTGRLISYARVIYGGDPLLDRASNDSSPTSGTIIKLPGSLLMDEGSRASIDARGDIDNDGTDDLVISTTEGTESGSVFIVFGSHTDPTPAQLDVLHEAAAEGRVVEISGFSNQVETRFVGDVDGDQLSDIVAVDGPTSYLFRGRNQSGWLQDKLLPLDDGVFRFDFEGTDSSFEFSDNDSTRNIWSVTDGRIVMGGDATYANRTTLEFPGQVVQDIFPTVASAASPLIDLRTAIEPTLYFDHLLQTENEPGRDIARLLVEVDGERFSLASNQDGSLPDGMSPAGAMDELSFSLSQFAGSQIRLVFDFDSVTPENNELFGWAIDNIRIEGKGTTVANADRLFSLSANHVAPLGDADGDGNKDDFAFIGDTEVQIYFGDSDLANMPTTQVGGSFENADLFAGGAIDGDSWAHAVIAGPSGSWLLFGDGVNEPNLVPIPVPDLRAVGDLNGDGFVELAAGVFEVNDTFDDPDRRPNAHWVTHLYMSDDPASDDPQDPDRMDRLMSASARPDLVLEMPDAIFLKLENTAALALDLPLFGSLGDVNADDREDFGVFSPLQSGMFVMFGGSTEPLPVDDSTTVATLPVEVALPRLAQPAITSTEQDGQPGVDLVLDETPSLQDAFAVEGVADGQQLSVGRAVGDVNGDGVMDVAIHGESVVYLILGPFDARGVQSIDDLANVVIADGQIAAGHGDVTEDGIDDIVLIREGNCVDDLCDLTLEIHAGGGGLDRQLQSTLAAEQRIRDDAPRGAVGAALLSWDGDEVADIVIAHDSPQDGLLAEIRSGTDLGSTTLSLHFDPHEVATSGLVVNENAGYTATPAGDVNCDGLDDLMIAAPDVLEFPNGAPAGYTFLVLGGRTGAVNLLTESDARIQARALGEVVSALGDINNDGLDDVAISRSLEAAGELDGGLLIYFGRKQYHPIPGEVLLLSDSDADLRLAREGAGSLVVGTAIQGRLNAVAGDLNDDGKADLIVGSPTQSIVHTNLDVTLQRQERGQTAIFLDVLSLGERMVWEQADHILAGATGLDRAGTIATAPLVDVNGDRLVDVFIGAGGFDGLIDGIRPDAGRVYFIAGSRSRIPLPDDADLTDLENFSGKLVDRQTGQPETFESLELSTDEDWYRFTFAGDGGATTNAADHIRVTPGASFAPFSVAPVDAGVVAEDGTVSRPMTPIVGGDDNAVSILEFDLRSLAREWSDPANIPQVHLRLDAQSVGNNFDVPGISQFTRVGDALYFVADDPDFGRSLFVTDGTSQGTRRLVLGTQVTDPDHLTDLGGVLLFTGNDDVAAATTELWKSDGTGAGTVKVTDIDISAEAFVAGGAKVFFATRGGLELWETDGTAANTVQVTISSFLDPIEGFDPASLTIVESDVEPDPIVFVDAKDTRWSESVLYATGGNNSNDPDGLFMVGDQGIGTRHRRPTNMTAFDGFLALQSRSSELQVTNGVIEGGGNRVGFSYFFTDIDNPTDLLTEVDGYQLTPAHFTRSGDFNEWVAANLDLNRDYLYLFADGAAAGRALFRVEIETIRDNGIRGRGLVNRENYDVNLRVTQVAAGLSNPRSLLLQGDDLYFVADDAALGGQVYRVSKTAVDATPERVTAINAGPSGAAPQEMTVAGDSVYFTATNGVQRDLYRIAGGMLSQVTSTVGVPTQLTAIGDRLMFLEDELLWQTDGSTTKTIKTDEFPTTDLSVAVLDVDGDGEVAAGDRSAPVATDVELTFEGRGSSFEINLAPAISDAISAGREQLTLRITTPAGTPEVQIVPGEDATRPNPRLDVEPSGLVADLVDEDGRLISRDKAITDLRNVKAGTYFLRVHRPVGVTAAGSVAYELEINAPSIGQSHPTTNRDHILGGDGDDLLRGSGELDVLFGESGLDLFQGESIEVFDLDEVSGETTRPTNEPSNQRPAEPDQPVLVGDGVDPSLRAGIARALGHPVTVGPEGRLITHQPIFASQMAELERLNLSGLGIKGLVGLEHAINLRFLDLRNNALTELALPTVHPHLEVLDAADNAIESLSLDDLSKAPNLKSLFVERNRIRDLSELAGIRIVDEGDVGYSEHLGSWQSEVFTVKSAWLDDYRYSHDGGEVEYQFSVPVGAEIDLFATWPTLDNDVAADAAYHVDSGDSLQTTIAVLQTLSPFDAVGDANFGGRPWQLLGRFKSTTGMVQVRLTGTSGPLAADAVRAELVAQPALSLESLYAAGNPISDVSRDEIISRLEAGPSAPNIFLTPNEQAPQLAPIGPQTARHGALSFDDQAVVLPDEVLDGVTSFLVEFWHQTEVANHGTVFSVAESDASSNEFFIALLDANTVRVADQNEGFDYAIPFDLTDGRWHQYAVSRDTVSETLRLYVDGQLIDSKGLPSVAPILVGNGGLVLGQEQDDLGGQYASSQATFGQLDELRFWDRFWEDVSQIDEHVAQFHDRTVGDDSRFLRAYYQFDTSDGEQAIDSSVNAWHGILGDSVIGNLDAARDTRPAPGRSLNAPVVTTRIVDLQTVDGLPVDADGDAITYSALSSTVGVGTSVVGNELLITYSGDFAGSARIAVTAQDENGRQSRNAFDWNVDSTELAAASEDLTRYV